MTEEHQPKNDNKSTLSPQNPR